MPVILTPELERKIAEKVKSGQYLSAREVIEEALQLLDERDRLSQLRLEELRQEIAAGLEEAERGESAVLDMAAILAESRKRLAEEGSRNICLLASFQP